MRIVVLERSATCAREKPRGHAMPPILEDLPKKEPKNVHGEVLELQVVARAAGAAGADGAAADAPAESEIWAVLSSETPCETWFGTEVWSHEKSAIDMSI